MITLWIKGSFAGEMADLRLACSRFGEEVMQVIRPGDMRRTLPWFCIRPIECFWCGCRVQLEAKDKPTLWNDIHTGCGGHIPCPTCTKPIYFYEEAMRGITPEETE